MSERVVYRINFWIEATEFTWDVYLTPDEAEHVTVWLDQNDDVTDLCVWEPTAALDGIDEFKAEIFHMFEAWPA